MKDQMKHLFKPTPERFRYAVSAAVAEAQQSAPAKKRHSKPLRVIIAIALVLAIIPSAVFGASKLIGLFAQPVDQYGVELRMDTPSDTSYPEYVKIHVVVPEGFAELPGTDERKYHRTDDAEYDSGFSLFPMRYTDHSLTEVIGNVDSYEKITLCGHTAYDVKKLDQAYNRLYVNYDDVNVTLLIYYNDVTDDELTAFVSGITFTEGTADDHTDLSEPYDEKQNYEQQKNETAYNYRDHYIALDPKTTITFWDFSEKHGDESVRYTAQMANVSVTDSINDLNRDNLNQMYLDEGIADSDGRLLPRTVTVTKYGDGFTSTDEVLSTEEKEQKLILVDLTYTNKSDEDISAYIPYNIEVLNKNDAGTYTVARKNGSDDNIISSELCDSEIFYVSDPVDKHHNFYCTPLKAYETKTVTIGFRCSADMLDNAYLTIYDATSAGIVDPAPAYSDRGEIPNYIIKVL